MPPNQEESPCEVSSIEQDFPLLQFMPSPIDYESISLTLSDHSIESLVSLAFYEALQIPQEPTLKELVQRATGCENTEEVTKVKLQVIARDVSLQHLSFHTPILRELILDGSVVSSLRDLGCNLRALKVLSVNRCGLDSLDGTFGLQTLEELHAARNNIKDISPCSHLPYIKIIDVKNNFIQDIAALTFLTMCPYLEQIILEGNDDIVQFPRYRRTVKSLLPHLKILDGHLFTEVECITENQEYNECDIQPVKETECDNASSQPISTKESFLPPITNTTKSSPPQRDDGRTSCYTVSFGPKLLQSLPSTSTSSEPTSDTIVSNTMFPDIARPSDSNRISSAPSNFSRLDKNKNK